MNIQCDEKSHDIILRFRDRWAKHKKRRYLNKDDMTQDSNFVTILEREAMLNFLLQICLNNTI